MPPNPNQPTNTNPSFSPNPNPSFTPAPTVPPVAPTLDSSPLSPTATQPKHNLLFLIIGAALAAILITVGVVYQTNYHATDDSGRTAAIIQAEIDQLNSEIATTSEKTNQIFRKDGFSEEFFNASSAQTELDLEKTALEATYTELVDADSEANIFRTGAIYFFIAAAVILIIAISIFLIRRSRASRI